MPDPSNPLPGRAVALLEHLRAHADADDCIVATRAELADALGVAQSTLQLAVTDLTDAGLLAVDVSRGRAPNSYCLQPTDEPTDRPLQPTDSTDRPTVQPTDRPISSDAHEHAPAPAHAGAQSPLPTPSEAETATDRPSPPAPASAHTREEPTDPQPTDAVPIGRLAVAAAIEAAVAAGRTVEAGMRGRIGQAAQRLAADEETATILAAARRLGEGGSADLYTAVRAVKEARPAASAVRTALDASAPVHSEIPRIHAALELLFHTWPRATVHVPTWEAELGRVREDILLDAVRALAKDGGEWPPHWGQVYRKAREIGEPRVLNERNDRRRAEEDARHEALRADMRAKGFDV